MALELSILIATMPSRKTSFDSLVYGLTHQIKGWEDVVEIISNDCMTYDIGTKRNVLLKAARGRFIVFIDDDDVISGSYVQNILKALIKDKEVDCIGICGKISIKGEFRDWYISKDYKKWYEKDKIYFRTPNHISPVKREIALKVGFPPIKHGEDAVYSQNILPYLKTETIIKEPIYFYYPSRK